MGAAGTVEIVSFLSCIKAGFIPCSLGFNQIDPNIGIEPLRQNLAVNGGSYLLNYFGFGGNSVSLVIRCPGDRSR